METNTTGTINTKAMEILDSLKWRSAIKKFDPSKQVSEEDINTLVEAGNLAPTSGGLQPFKLLVIKNDEIRNNLRPASFGQPQVTDASYLFVFCIQNVIDQSLVDAYIKRVMEVRDLDSEAVSGLSQALSGFVSFIGEPNTAPWAAQQAYISLGTVITTAAQMGIDTCPMGGFEPDKYVEILNLNEMGITPVALLAVGYRAEDDPFANAPKVRKKREDFVTFIS